jgi:The  BURPS668_1122 family of deaminases
VDNKGTKENWEIGNYKPALNETHPEYKIYNETAAKLQEIAKAQGIDVSELKGTMVVYTEREMCSGCKNTTSTGFEGMFPGIKLIVIYSKTYETK